MLFGCRANRSPKLATTGGPDIRQKRSIRKFRHAFGSKRKMLGRFAAAATFAVVSMLHGQNVIETRLEPLEAEPPPIKITLCDLIQKANETNGKMVEVRAIVKSYVRYWRLEDPKCGAHLDLGGDAEILGRYTGKSEYAFLGNESDASQPERVAWKPVPPRASVQLVRDSSYRELEGISNCDSPGSKR
jgi:hypothetical protein